MLTFLAAVTLLVLLGLLALPILLLAVQVIAALLPARARAELAVERPRAAILIPAHDEAAGIAATLASVMPQLAAGDRLLVVADNCTDRTAQVARACGAEVVERSDAALRGKGYALDFGMRHLAADAPECVVVVDADCIVHAGALDRLLRLCAHSRRPVQALYLMRAPAGGGLRARIAEFAWLLKNRVRPAGYARLGQPCQLMGSGMCFPWPLLAQAELASGEIVEDLLLGLSLAARGAAPLFCAEALVSSQFPGTAEGTQSQRRRWEHGHLALILRMLPRRLPQALRRRELPLLALLLDLCVPPLALLALMTAVGNLLAWGLYFFGGDFFVAAAASLLLLLFALVVALAWAKYGRAVIAFRQLLLAPLYALGKLPLYLRFCVGRQVDWVRSKRDTD